MMQSLTPQGMGRTMDDMATGTSRVVESLTGISGEFQSKLLLSALSVLVIIVLRRLLLRVVHKRLDEPRVRYRWGKVSGYVATLLTIVLIINIWLEGIRSLGTFLGLLTAGLAIALKDLVANLAGWLFILWRRPFDLGDRIQIGPHAGDVVDIRLFQFTLLEIGNWVDADQSTGRIIHMPNAKVFSEPLANYTAQFPFLWNELHVLVTFESEWRRAKAIVHDIVTEAVGTMPEEAERAMRDASRKLLIFYQKFTPIVYTDVKDSGIQLTIRYLCNPRHRRGTAQVIWETMLDAFAQEPGIDLAYPTQRMYLNPVEGKSGARAPIPWAGEAPPPGPGDNGGAPDHPGDAGAGPPKESPSAEPEDAPTSGTGG